MRLGISAVMVGRLVARGMPLDEAGARAWRRTHLAPFRTKESRVDRNPGRRQPQSAPQPMTADEMVALTEAIAEIMCDDHDRPGIFAEGMPYLRAMLCHLSDVDCLRVRLPPRALDALLGDD